VSGVAVEADVTVTFVAEKVGFTRAGADRYTGRIIVADIGAPPETGL
jgi:NAD(P)H-hydrate repair Nnr-like enzyme with NAD(P)H-hydrate epimerase domain